MQRLLPILVIFLTGTFMLLEIFFENPWVKVFKEFITDYASIILAFTFVLLLIDVSAREIPRVWNWRSNKEWPFALTLLLGMAVSLAFGLVGGKNNAGFRWIFDYLYDPLQSTMFSLLAFYITSAAFRAFRVRNFQATLLLCVALLVMLGRIPLATTLVPTLADIQDWIMNVPNLAGKRAILIGAAVGAIATSLRVILGLERDVLGGGN